MVGNFEAGGNKPESREEVFRRKLALRTIGNLRGEVETILLLAEPKIRRGRKEGFLRSAKTSLRNVEEGARVCYGTHVETGRHGAGATRKNRTGASPQGEPYRLLSS